MTQTKLPPPPAPPPVQFPVPWKTCPHCRAQAQTLDSRCPHCRKSYKNRTVLKVLLGLTLIGLVFVVGCAALISSAADEVDKELDAMPSKGDGADASPSEDGSTFENGVLTTSDVKVKITRYKVIEVGQEGNEYGEKPVIAFWYKTTNLSGAKVDPSTDFIVNVTAYQDNNPNAENELDVGSLPDDRFLDSQTENIKKGGTVENAVAYELDDLDTPVELVATEGLDEVIGKTTYKLR